MQWFMEVLKKYAVFEGRARRSEYWYFFLFYILFYIGIVIIETMLGIAGPTGDGGILSWIYSLGMLVPSLAVAVRRVHDVGKSGWFILIPIYNFILMVTPGEVGENEYGPDPKNPNADLSDHLVG